MSSFMHLEALIKFLIEISCAYDIVHYISCKVSYWIAYIS